MVLNNRVINVDFPQNKDQNLVQLEQSQPPMKYWIGFLSINLHDHDMYERNLQCVWKSIHNCLFNSMTVYLIL